jgi:imidazoleglycerol phosphate synthase glutamine amidotransferase subunit HisH
VSTPSELLGAKRIILPGVGAFDAGMSKLKEYDLISPLAEQCAHYSA